MTHFSLAWVSSLGESYFRRWKNIPKSFYRITVKGLVMNDAWKILLLREGRFADKKSIFYRTDNGMYDLPGWGLDWGEDFWEGLARELSEEIWLKQKDIEISKNPLYVYLTELDDRYYDDKKRDEFYPVCMFIYPLKLSHFDFRESPECTGYEWVSIEDFSQYPIWTHSAHLVDVFQKWDFPKKLIS